jgi:photosystem II stability/assembly factor-like uncharacterized protein
MYRLLIISVLLVFFATDITKSQQITWLRTDKSLSGNVNEIVYQDGALFAGTVAGIHKSTNGGDSWFLSNTGLDNTKVFALAVMNDNEIYCGTHDGVYYSDNKGSSWTKRSDGITDKYITTICIKDDSTLYAGTLYSGMFYTNNGGESWVKVTGDFSDMAVNAIAIRHTGDVYVGTTSALYRSDANGQNFIKMKNNLPAEINVYTITIRRNGIVYFGTRKGVLYRTINNGNSWTQQLKIPEKTQIYSSLLTPTGALILGTYGNGVYRSNDNAETWEQINDGLSNKKIMCLTQADNGDFYAGTWGEGVFVGAEPPITTSASGTFCASEELTVSYTLKDGFKLENDNIFYVEISDEYGSFAKPDTIGSLKSTEAGTIVCRLPKDLKTGNHFVRVVSSAPAKAGSSSEIFIHALPDMKFKGKTQVCVNSMEQYGIPSQTDIRSMWFVQGGSIKTPATADTIDVEWQYAEDASITLVRYNVITQCSDTIIKQVTFNPQPEKPTITRMGQRLVSSANEGNQWYRNGVLLEGKTDKILELEEPGLYTVQATNGFGCISPMSDEYDYNWNSVEDTELAGSINVYPVPSEGIIHLDFNLSEPANVGIEIYTLAGEKAGESISDFIDTGNSQTLDMSGFTNGTYYLKITIDKTSIMKKIIIRK